MDLNDYQEFVRATNLHYGKLGYLGEALELAAETGEVIEIFQKAERGTQQFDSRRLLDECSDVLWALTAITDKLGYSLEELADYNYDKLTKRLSDKD